MCVSILDWSTDDTRVRSAARKVLTMTSALAFKQSMDLNPALAVAANKRSHDPKLIGRWLNTNRDSKGLAECTIATDGENYSVSIVGVGKEALLPWPSVTATTLANLEEEAKQQTVALAADFDFSFMKAETHIRVNRGVLVIVLFVTFKDDSGRSNYLNREFFFREE